MGGLIFNAVSFWILTLICMGGFKVLGIESKWQVLFGLAWGMGTGIVTWPWILPTCFHLWICDRKRRILGEF